MKVKIDPPPKNHHQYDQLPLKWAARPRSVETRDLNCIEESRAKRISNFCVQTSQTVPELLVAILTRK
jgi:hypothetical protein